MPRYILLFFEKKSVILKTIFRKFSIICTASTHHVCSINQQNPGFIQDSTKTAKIRHIANFLPAADQHGNGEQIFSQSEIYCS